jgi:hypothetical protein
MADPEALQEPSHEDEAMEEREELLVVEATQVVQPIIIEEPSLNWHAGIMSLLGALPLLVAFAIQLGPLRFAVYFVVLVGSVPLAVKLQDAPPWLRWISGFVVVTLLSGIKTSVLLLEPKTPLLVKVLFYATSALWECSNAVLIFGGRPLMEKRGMQGLPCYGKALVASLAPAQVQFKREEELRMSPFCRWSQRSLHLAVFLATGYALRVLFQRLPTRVEVHPILETECMVQLLSCFVMVLDLPSHWWQLVMILSNSIILNNHNNKIHVQIIYPYGAVYFSTCARDFWSKWSRPASQLIRYMVYYPLGGNDPGQRWYSWGAVPLMFFLNGTSHYNVSQALVGDRAEKAWNLVFGILGLSAWMEVVAHQLLSREWHNSWSYKIVRGILAHVCFRIAAYILMHKCLHLSLASLL